MALYHFHVTQISRGAGQSSVAAAAYRAGEKLSDNYYGMEHDYTKKGGVVMSEILLPAHAPERFSDRQTLWNEVEQIEKNKKAQLAYSFDFALQNELSMDENIRIAREFIEENLVTRGMICDMAVHDPGRDPGDVQNPHVHVMVPMRPLNEDGSWGNKQHREYILDDEGNRIKGPDGKYIFNAVKNTDWGEPETLDFWRAKWAEKVNEAFEKNGISEKIDNRSYLDRGIDLLPQVHEGPVVRAMEKKGIRTDMGDWNRFIKALNDGLRNIFDMIRAIIEVIEEVKREQAEAKAVAESNWKELQAALDEYETELRQKYTYAHGRIASQKMIDLHCFVINNDIRRLDDFEDVVKMLYGNVSDAKRELKQTEDEKKECDRIINLWDKLQENLKYYKKWYKISEPEKKAAYAEAHHGELNIYHMAARELKKTYPDLTVPIKAIKKKRDDLKERTVGLRDRYKKYEAAAKQAYVFNKQVYGKHMERKRMAERSR